MPPKNQSSRKSERKSTPQRLSSTPQGAASTSDTPLLSNKRVASSPLDSQEYKKQLLSESVSGIDSDIDCEQLVVPDMPVASSEPKITLQHEDMAKIANLLKDSFHTEFQSCITQMENRVESVVERVVEKVFQCLQSRIDAIESDNQKLHMEISELRVANKSLTEEIRVLHRKTDDLEQYSRRNSLRISGLPEPATEDNTDDVIADLCSTLELDIGRHNIDRSHRIGRKAAGKSRPIIVKFTSYNARRILYKARFQLKSKGLQGVFINEDLTKSRNDLLYKARQLVKSGTFSKAWSSDGLILVRDNEDKIQRFSVCDDISEYE